MNSPTELAEAFRAQGLKVTPQRRLLFALLEDDTTHPTADGLFARASAHMPGISLRTVYTTLTDLVEMGELQAVALGSGAMRFDPNVDEGLVDLGVNYVSLDEALAVGDIVTLNCPLNEHTHHLVNATSIAKMKRGAMLVNTGRGALIDTAAVLDALKSEHIGSLALDVYEEEGDLFFEDRSDEILDDDNFARLLTYPNVLITAHQAFLTHEALAAIAATTIANVATVLAGEPCANAVISG